MALLETTLHLILRDFEQDELDKLGVLVNKVCDAVQAGEPRAHITCEITNQYKNMRYWLENDMTPVELARSACDELSIEHFSDTYPWRHRWLALDRNGSPHSEPDDRNAAYPRSIGMVQCPGYGPHD